MRGHLLAALAALTWIAGHPAIAAETYAVYLCSFQIKGFGDVKTNLLFARDAAGRVFTIDDGPDPEKPVRVPVQVRPAGPGTSIFLFAVSVPNRDVGRMRITFQARVPEAGGPARISARARGFSGNPTGPGTCELKRDVPLPF